MGDDRRNWPFEQPHTGPQAGDVSRAQKYILSPKSIRYGSKINFSSGLVDSKISLFRTAILILHCSIPQPWMFDRGHHNPLWHLLLQFRMWVKRWSVLFIMCSRIWSLLYGHCHGMWVYPLLKYILHQKSRISEYLHSFKWWNMCLYH